MSTPGFTAEASRYGSTECYSMTVRFVDHSSSLVGQQITSPSWPFPDCFVDCFIKCTHTHPGPFTPWPCIERCLRECRIL